MKNNKKILILVGIVVIVIIIAVGIVTFVTNKYSGTAGTSGIPVGTSEPGNATGTATHAPAPANVVVPDKGAQNVPANVAVPQIVAPAAPSASASYRSFNITVQNGQFTPSNIIVNRNDVVNIQLSAVGADYAFTQPDYGFNLQVPAGQTKKVQFTATASGKFTFYCGSCGGPAKGPVGYLTVAQ